MHQAIIAALYRNRERIFEELRKKRKKLESYEYLQRNLLKTDVSGNCDYQRTYNGFYKVRFPGSERRDSYYALLEHEKQNLSISFVDVIRKMFDLTGRVEPSFSSKLLSLTVCCEIGCQP
jgi:hypothetical protein